jgi:hypothetical protein
MLILLLLCGSGLFAQIPCEKGLRSDSVVINRFTYAKEAVELMEVTIKNNYQLQFIKKGQATFLKIIVRDNLGFGQIGEFMLYCGKKQIYNKDMKLVPIDKTSGYFVIELNPSYTQTIRDFGLNKLIFRDTVEFLIPKSDSEKIKQTASCFYDAIMPK